MSGRKWGTLWKIVSACQTVLRTTMTCTKILDQMQQTEGYSSESRYIFLQDLSPFSLERFKEVMWFDSITGYVSMSKRRLVWRTTTDGSRESWSASFHSMNMLVPYPFPYCEAVLLELLLQLWSKKWSATNTPRCNETRHSRNACDVVQVQHHLSFVQNVQLSFQFAWNDWKAMQTSMLLNTSPEFELAVYTVCALSGGQV